MERLKRIIEHALEIWGDQALAESRQTGAWLIAGWASRPVLEEMSSSWRPGHGIVEAMRGSVLGAESHPV